MRSAYNSTALALLFGLGVAVSGVPASAEQAAGRAGGASQEQLAAGQQTGGQTATGGQTGSGQMTTGGAAAGQTGATAGQAGTETGQTGATTAAGTGAGMGAGEDVTGEQAAARSEERWEELTGGAEHMTQDQFGAGMTGAQDAQASFSEVDEDGDGQISREEWMNWREQGFAGATQGTEGRMSGEDFETWDTGGEVSPQ